MMPVPLDIASWTIREASVAAAAAGVGSHICFYKYGEHHMKAPLLFWFYLILFLTGLYRTSLSSDFSTALWQSGTVFAAHIFGLMFSIAIYRRYFHRLRSFPGPPMAALTKLWHTAHSLDSQNHLLLDKLHKKYGDFVRTGKSGDINFYISLPG